MLQRGDIYVVEGGNNVLTKTFTSVPCATGSGGSGRACSNYGFCADHLVQRPPDFRPDRVLLKIKPGATDDQVLRISRPGTRLLQAWPDRIRVIGLASDVSVNEALLLYRESGLADYAEPDFLRRYFITPNDPNFADQWGLNNASVPDADIDAPAGWDRQKDAPNIIVAVVDNRAKLDHEDLMDNL